MGSVCLIARISFSTADCREERRGEQSREEKRREKVKRKERKKKEERKWRLFEGGEAEI